MVNTRRTLIGAVALLAITALGSGCASAAPRQSASASASAKTSVKDKANSAKSNKAKTNSSKVIYTTSLNGSKTTKSFTAKSPWQLSYYYNCSGKRGSFTLYLKHKNGHSLKVTSQSGLGGGGTRSYARGTYSLSATTTCKWTVTAAKKTAKKT